MLFYKEALTAYSNFTCIRMSTDRPAYKRVQIRPLPPPPPPPPLSDQKGKHSKPKARVPTATRIIPILQPPIYPRSTALITEDPKGKQKSNKLKYSHRADQTRGNEVTKQITVQIPMRALGHNHPTYPLMLFPIRSVRYVEPKYLPTYYFSR